MSITVRNLTKYYGRECAVNDVSFDVRPGEIIGFLGPNGAGKTTTMKILTCFMPPTSGAASVEGYDILAQPFDVRRAIGYLPENNPLYTDMNVLEYLEFTAQLNGVRGPQLAGRLREMVEVCGLASVRHKEIGELSKGYRQRVGLAQAMIHDPSVLILDEPTSGLDPNQIVEIRKLIRSLGRAKTVILSTHILQEVTAVCDRVIIIHKGSIVADGTPRDLQESYRGADRISIELQTNGADPMQTVFPKLTALPGVVSAEYAASDDLSKHRFVLSAQKGADVRADVFRLAVAERWVLTELVRSTTSLEEVFHQLTRE